MVIHVHFLHLFSSFFFLMGSLPNSILMCCINTELLQLMMDSVLLFPFCGVPLKRLIRHGTRMYFFTVLPTDPVPYTSGAMRRQSFAPGLSVLH